MANWFTDRIATGVSLLKCNAGNTVSLTQGAATIEGLVALKTNAEHPTIDQEGFPTSITTVDWAIQVSDLNGLTIRPGAVITETKCGVVARYEALPLGRNRQCTSPKGNTGIMLTIHTKQVT